MTAEERTENRQLWEMYIQDQKESGMDQMPWCEANGLNYSSFRYWKRKFDKEKNLEKGPQWILVASADDDVARINLPNSQEQQKSNANPPRQPVSAATQSAVCIKAGVFSIEIPAATDPVQISQILTVLKSLC